MATTIDPTQLDWWQYIALNPLILNGFAAGVVAIWAIYASRATARRQVTISKLQSKLWDREYLEVAREFYSLLNNSAALKDAFELHEAARKLKQTGEWDTLPKDEQSRHDAASLAVQNVRTMLNDRELIAIGIREKIYDETIFRRYWYPTLLEEADRSAEFILQTKRGVPAERADRVYREFQDLARRWREAGPIGAEPNLLHPTDRPDHDRAVAVRSEPCLGQSLVLLMDGTQFHAPANDHPAGCRAGLSYPGCAMGDGAAPAIIAA